MAAEQPVYREIVTETWEAARDLSRRLWGWIFRGQESTSWELTTTLDRGPEYRRYERWRLRVVEREILEQFQRRAYPSLPDAPALDDPLEWTALLQAHGGPTRLLEFTYSFYVAAFFAMERATGGDTAAAIWAVNPGRLRTEALRKVSDGWRDEDAPGLNPEAILGSYADLYRYVLRRERPIRMVNRFEPHRMTERLAAQQGLFLAPSDLEATFDDNLFGTFDASPSAVRVAESLVHHAGRKPEIALADLGIIKVVLPGNLHQRALHELRAMNITAATLFPGLDGFARSLFIRLGRDRGGEPDAG